MNNMTKIVHENVAVECELYSFRFAGKRKTFVHVTCSDFTFVRDSLGPNITPFRILFPIISC